MRGLIFAICGSILLGGAAARAAECPGNPDALGTSRTIVVDPSEHPRVGTMQYGESLPLDDHEVVLTFDDGPLPPYSNQVLEILASECVKATYFMIGRMARSFPDMARKIRDAGHTIGTHSQNHPLKFHKMPVERSAQEIDDGIASVTAALGEPPAPFFRIPGLLRADGVEHYLAAQHLMVWSADFPADDWLRISPAQVYARALQRIEVNHRGILLLHDIHARTVAALPALLKELKRRGYRIVHVVPATPDLPKTATERRQWLRHVRQIWPQVAIYSAIDPELPAPSPASFGFDEAPLSPPPPARRLAPRPHGIALRGKGARQAAGEVAPPQPSPWSRAAELPPVSPSDADPSLPAPDPQNFGYAQEAPAPRPEHKAQFDVVPEVNVTVNDIPHLRTDRDQADGSPTRPAPGAARHGPIATTSIPHGAFP